MRFEVYSKDNCTYCTYAERILRETNQDYVIYKLGDDYTIDEFRAKFPEHRTFPAVMMNGKLIGGSDQIMQYINTMSLSL